MTGNRLAGETSPYLLQHKDNPVHWRPWGPEVLADAKETGKPILLSVGYAACHWCHVMAHESFENEDIAALMNEHFVNIKVDREERPDIDAIYMSALHMLGEQGGWPLTMFLTPDGEPFWGGTYFPPEPRYGRPGFPQILTELSRIFREEPEKIENNRAALLQALAARSAKDARATPPADLAERVAGKLLQVMDGENGGIQGAPKFPQTGILTLLWRVHLHTDNDTFAEPVLKALNHMCEGGIYDHLGGGFARYTVDAEWLVPHFEKMLYDNAHFIRHCVWAHSETGSELFRTRIEETISWLSGEMMMPANGFAASLDADSEGEEGKYYVWALEEVTDVLGAKAESFAATYDITAEGNWEGKNIPNLSAFRRDPDRAAREITRHAASRKTLLNRRETRIPPGRDTKVLADWNGYAIRAIAEAGRYFGSESWLGLAGDQFRALMTILFGDKRLAHLFDGDRVSDFGFATDYAAMIAAALALHEATGEADFLSDAERLADMLKRNHFDFESSRGFWMQERDSTDTPVLTWNDLDEANPAATAQILESLSRLALLTDDVEMTGLVDSLAREAAGRILQSRFGQAGFINAADSVLAARKLVIVGNDRATDPLSIWATRHPDPRRTDQFLASGTDNPQFPRAGAYLCAEMKCSPPVGTDGELKALLAEGM